MHQFVTLGSGRLTQGLRVHNLGGKIAFERKCQHHSARARWTERTSREVRSGGARRPIRSSGDAWTARTTKTCRRRAMKNGSASEPSGSTGHGASGRVAPSGMLPLSPSSAASVRASNCSGNVSRIAWSGRWNGSGKWRWRPPMMASGKGRRSQRRLGRRRGLHLRYGRTNTFRNLSRKKTSIGLIDTGALGHNGSLPGKMNFVSHGRGGRDILIRLPVD